MNNKTKINISANKKKMTVKQALYRTNVSNLDCEKPLREIHNMTLMSHNDKNYKY